MVVARKDGLLPWLTYHASGCIEIPQIFEASFLRSFVSKSLNCIKWRGSIRGFRTHGVNASLLLFPLLCAISVSTKFSCWEWKIIRDTKTKNKEIITGWCSTPTLLITICTALKPRCTVHIYTYIHHVYIFLLSHYIYIYVYHIYKRYLTRITQFTKEKFI